jgi:hypothetical protein
LKLDHAAGQPGNGAPEVGVFHVGVRIAKAEGGQIQFVERVEEIGAKIEHRVLSKAANPAEADLPDETLFETTWT